MKFVIKIYDELHDEFNTTICRDVLDNGIHQNENPEVPDINFEVLATPRFPKKV